MQDEGFGTDETRLGHDDSVAGIDDAAKAIGTGLGKILADASSVLDGALRSGPERAGLTDPLGPLPEPPAEPAPAAPTIPGTWGTEPDELPPPPGIEPGVVEY
jgi:hypothetical protein